MEFEPEAPPQVSARTLEFIRSDRGQPLVLLRDTERSLRRKTVQTIAPLLPSPLATQLGEASLVADESLEQLAGIDLDAITDAELKPARIMMGLTFVGFGALALGFLLLYLYTLHADLKPIEQIRQYWYPYVLLVSIGIAGMFMLGREAMRWGDEPDDHRI